MGWIPHWASVYTWILSTCQSSAVFIAGKKEWESGYSTPHEKSHPTCRVTLTFPHSWGDGAGRMFPPFCFHFLRVFFTLLFMTTGFSCQWEYEGSFSRVSDLIWLTRDTIFMPSQKLTETSVSQWFHLFPTAFFSEEGIHFWRSSWGQLSPMTDQHRSFSARGGRWISDLSHAFREESRNMWSPDSLNISPTWHLASPHVALSQYFSSIKGIHCVFHHISVFNISHCRASSGQTQARMQTICTGI